MAGRKNTEIGLAAQSNPVVDWMNGLRAAMFDAIGEQDIKDIVKGIVERTKKGDPAATKMVFEYVLGGKSGPPQPQININIEADHPDPTKALRGSAAKVDVLARRLQNGQALHHPEDA